MDREVREQDKMGMDGIDMKKKKEKKKIQKKDLQD